MHVQHQSREERHLYTSLDVFHFSFQSHDLLIAQELRHLHKEIFQLHVAAVDRGRPIFSPLPLWLRGGGRAAVGARGGGKAQLARPRLVVAEMCASVYQSIAPNTL